MDMFIVMMVYLFFGCGLRFKAAFLWKAWCSCGLRSWHAVRGLQSCGALGSIQKARPFEGYVAPWGALKGRMVSAWMAGGVNKPSRDSIPGCDCALGAKQRDFTNRKLRLRFVVDRFVSLYPVALDRRPPPKTEQRVLVRKITSFLARS